MTIFGPDSFARDAREVPDQAEKSRDNAFQMAEKDNRQDSPFGDIWS
jgi:hypothetical protein